MSTIKTLSGLNNVVLNLDNAIKALKSGRGMIRSPGALGIDKATFVALVQSASASQTWRESVGKIALAYFAGAQETRANLEFVAQKLKRHAEWLRDHLSTEQESAPTATATPVAVVTQEQVSKRFNVVRADYKRADIELALDIAENEAPASALAKVEEAAKALPALVRKAEQARRDAAAKARAEAALQEATALRGNATRLRQLLAELQTVEGGLEYEQGTGGQAVLTSAKNLGFPTEGEGVVIRALISTMRPDRRFDAEQTFDRLYFGRGGRPTRGALKAFASGLVKQVQYLLSKIEAQEVQASVEEELAAILGKKPAKAVQAAAATVSTTERLRARLERALGADAYSTRANAVERNRAEFAAAKTDDARKAVVQRCEGFAFPKDPGASAREAKERGQIAEDLMRLAKPAAPKSFGEILASVAPAAPQSEATPAN